MPIETLVVELVPGVNHSKSRAVAFLRGDSDLDAGIEFDKVASHPLGKRLRHRMYLWIAGKPDTRGKFHRFKQQTAKYRDCFVFKDLDAKVRLYGFTCHPLPHTNPKFELVVLTTHATKNQDLTDTAELDRVLAWQADHRTVMALDKSYHGELSAKAGRAS